MFCCMWGQGGSGCGRWWECVCILHGSGGGGGGGEWKEIMREWFNGIFSKFCVEKNES